MPDTVTPVLGLVKPEINGPQTENVWGFDINANFDKIDARIGQMSITEAPADGILYGRVNATWWPAAPLNSPALTGTPTAPTPVYPSYDAQIATVWYVAQAVDLLAPKDSPALTGNPTAPTPAPGDNDTSIATTAFVTQLAIASGAVLPSNVAPQPPGTANAGISALYSRGDHTHPADPTRVAKAGDVMTGTLTAPQYNLTAGGGLLSSGDYTYALGPAGEGSVLLGGATARANIYRNGTHLFQARDATANYLTIDANKLDILQTTPSSGTTTGALTVAGGIGIAGNGNFGGSLVANGSVSIGGSLTLPASQILNFGNQFYMYGANATAILQANNYALYNLAGTIQYVKADSSGVVITAGNFTVNSAATIGGAMTVNGSFTNMTGTVYLRGAAGDPNQSIIYLNANNSIYMHQTGGAISFAGVPVYTYNGFSNLNGTVIQSYGAGNQQALRLFHDNTYSWLQTPTTWVMGGYGGGPASTIFQGPGSTNYTNGTIICQGGIGCNNNINCAGSVNAANGAFSGQVTFGSVYSYGDVYAGGNMATPGTLNVTGAASFYSAQVSTTFHVGGTTDLSGQVFMGGGTPAVVGNCSLGLFYPGGEQAGAIIRPANEGTNWAILLLNSAANGVGGITTGVSTAEFHTTSDVRLKDDPKPFDAGPMIDALETWDFRWRKTGKRTYGIFAQDAIKIVPQACMHDPERDQWFTDYSKFVPILLAEMKALRARVAELEGRA